MINLYAAIFQCSPAPLCSYSTCTEELSVFRVKHYDQLELYFCVHHTAILQVQQGTTTVGVSKVGHTPNVKFKVQVGTKCACSKAMCVVCWLVSGLFLTSLPVIGVLIYSTLWILVADALTSEFKGVYV